MKKRGGLKKRTYTLLTEKAKAEAAKLLVRCNLVRTDLYQPAAFRARRSEGARPFSVVAVICPAERR